MKKIAVLILMVLALYGCGKTIKETITEETTETNYVTRREPYPILRPYANSDGIVEFTDITASIELTKIFYNNYKPDTGWGQEDGMIMKVPANSSGNVVTIQVRGKTYKWACHDNLAHSVVFNAKVTPDTEWPDFRYLGCTEDILDANNQYDFVRLFVNGVLYEMYYIADFEVTE